MLVGVGVEEVKGEEGSVFLLEEESEAGEEPQGGSAAPSASDNLWVVALQNIGAQYNFTS